MDTSMLLSALVLMARVSGSAEAPPPPPPPAAARCCADPSWLMDVDSGVCLNRAGLYAADMLISCVGNITIASDDETYKIAIQSDERILLVVEPLETDLISGRFCLGNVSGNTTVAVGWERAVLCADPEEERSGVDARTAAIITILSMPFCILTLLVYALLPELRDLQGKSVMCLCVSLVLGTGILAYENLFQYSDMDTCAAGGFLRYYFLLATFLWMNAITVQVFLSVRKCRGGGGGGKSAHAFLYYSCYAWGVPAALLGVVLHNNYRPGVPTRFVPGIGLNTCWFFGSLSHWLYFYGPLTVTLAANCIFFVWTTFSLWRHNFATTQRKALRYKFVLSVRLFVVMGVSWLLEPVSFAHSHYHVVWLIADIWNLLQGVMMFIVLVVLRKRAMLGLVSRGYTLCLTEPLRRCLDPAADAEGTPTQDTERAVDSEFTILRG